MSKKRWKGLKSLIHDGVDATVELVREGHESTARNIIRVTDQVDSIKEPARAIDGIRKVATAGVLGSVKVVNRAVESVTDAGIEYVDGPAEPGEEAPPTTGIENPIPLRSDAIGSAHWLGDAALAAVNAVVGDHLSDANNGLDLSMVFRAGDFYVPLEADAMREALPEASPRVVLFLHGLGASEWSWFLESESYHGDPEASFATLLEQDLGLTPIFLRYNTGRHVSENGRTLADQMDQFVEAYPVPIEELTIIGHSMGGLVARSACHYGAQDEMPWTSRVKRVFYLGSPHQGAPLAKLGHVVTDALGSVDLPTTRILSKILDGRSQGVKDLSHGALIDEEWLVPPTEEDRESLPLPDAVHTFISATITKDPGHPISKLIGDLLVCVPSASGPKESTEQFEIETNHYGGVLHHQLQNHPAVYAQIRAALETE